MKRPPRILVTGATGFVGRALVARLIGEGCIVRAATRAKTTTGASEQAVVGEIDGQTDWRETVQQVDFVVHAAGRAHILDDKASNPLKAFRTSNRDATLRLARQASDAGVRRFIFISTIGVNGSETAGHPLTIGGTPQPHSPYAQSKWEAEIGLREITAGSEMEHVVIRPPLIIGRDPKGNLGTLLGAIRKGVPLPFGAVTRNRRDLVSLDTLNDLIATVVDNPGASNQTFLVSDGSAVSTRQIAEELARLHGLSPRFLPVPPSLLGASLRLIGKASLASQLCGDLEIDMTHTRGALNWTPPSLL